MAPCSRTVSAAGLLCVLLSLALPAAGADDAAEALVPLTEQGQPTDWWFAFKFSAANFPECGPNAQRACPFGGTVQDYRYGFGQQFVFASSNDATLEQGQVCLGATSGSTGPDPLGATFGRIYDGDDYFVVWNDQFYEQPPIEGCSTSCSSPWGHAKGMLAWDDEGNGLVLQVTTPAWPGAGSRSHPRAAGGNTLGCVSLDDDIAVAQHFFALKLDADDVKKVLRALANASVVTDVHSPQIVNNGGPADIQALVSRLGVQSQSTDVGNVTLSSGVQLISKPSALHVPPWQLVSATLGGMDLRAATWWADPEIDSTTSETNVSCWQDDLGEPGAVTIATSGSWQGTTFSLKGGLGNAYNHAKFAVEDVAKPTVAIFGDMNQQGALVPGGAYEKQKCSSSQNGRGGTFYVVRDEQLAAGLAALIKGASAPVTLSGKNVSGSDQ
ncbi:MAG: deoxyribonuclease II family protein [Pseudomonadota bacterium]